MSDCERFAQIAWDKLATVSEWLRSLMTKESNCEQIAQVIHDKRATVSDSLTSLMMEEQMSKSLFFLSELLTCSFAHKKWAIRSKHLTNIVFFGMFFNIFCKFFLKEWFAYSLLFNEQYERITEVAHQNWAMWVNCSGRSPKMSDCERFPHGRSPELSDPAQIAQVAHQKWVNCSFAHFLQKTLNSLRK